MKWHSHGWLRGAVRPGWRLVIVTLFGVTVCSYVLLGLCNSWWQLWNSGVISNQTGPDCLYSCPRFWRAEVEMGGDLTGVALVNIQAKTILEYLRVYIQRRNIALATEWSRWIRWRLKCIVTGAVHWRDKFWSNAHSVKVTKRWN